MKIGLINHLKIERESEHGLYLVDEEENDVLLPIRYLTDEMNVGDEIDVFVYLDSEDRIIATTETPKASLGEFGYFEVVATTPFGAFVDWGLLKDLFVPFAHQKNRLKEGDWVILKIIIDEKTNRLIGSSKVQQYLSTKTENLKRNNALSLFIIAKTPLGFKVIANNLFEGMIYHNEIFEDVNIGDTKEGFVKAVRKDGKVDFSLRAIGIKSNDEQKVLEKLNSHESFMPYNYKSDADDIQKAFGLSKKAFKKALTNLANEKKIIISDEGIKKL